MPIDIETFEQQSNLKSDDTHAVRILRFLATNDQQAFRRGEIAETTDIDANAVSAVLSRLKERGLVRHKPPYWTVGDERRLAAATDLGRSLDVLDERLGTEDMDEWRDAGGEESLSSEIETDAE